MKGMRNSKLRIPFRSKPRSEGPNTNYRGLPADSVHALAPGSGGALWVGTWGGVGHESAPERMAPGLKLLGNLDLAVVAGDSRRRACFL
jgi:hypothetical protein